jgi:hypothetical protein
MGPLAGPMVMSVDAIMILLSLVVLIVVFGLGLFV